MKKIYFARTKDGAVLPSKRVEDAGYDLYACFNDDYVRFAPFETKLISTGIAYAISKGYYMQIEERSSTGVKGLKKSSGVIDSGFRGEIVLTMFNANNMPLYISKLPHEQIEKIEKSDKFVYLSYEKAIAQGVVHKIPNLKVQEISYKKLKAIKSQRQTGMLGSTKK